MSKYQNICFVVQQQKLKQKSLKSIPNATVKVIYIAQFYTHMKCKMNLDLNII